MTAMTAVQIQAEARRRQRARAEATTTTTAVAGSSWSLDAGHYVNRETGRPYTPHHEAERLFVYSDTPRRALAKGGEGGGKSVAGVIKDLERLSRGMHGIMGAPDFEHFKRSRSGRSSAAGARGST
jgi:hypothetical protein